MDWEQNLFLLRVPDHDENTHRPTGTYTVQKISTKEEFLEVLAELRDNFYPDWSLFDVHKAHFPQLCGEAVIDQVSLYYMNLETTASTYHTLPESGGIWDQPQYVLDMFDIIRGERARAERQSLEEARKKFKK